MTSIENTEVCNFVLNCSDISISDLSGNYPFINDVGSINYLRTEMTWFNINLRNIIGEKLFNKYEVFNLKLSAISNPNIAVFISTGNFANDACVSFYISGLNWLNSSYNTVRGCNTGEVALGNTNLASGVSSTLFNNSFMATFSKTETANITIKYISCLGIPPRPNANGNLFPRMAFYFTIIPVR